MKWLLKKECIFLIFGNFLIILSLLKQININNKQEYNNIRVEYKQISNSEIHFAPLRQKRLVYSPALG